MSEVFEKGKRNKKEYKEKNGSDNFNFRIKYINYKFNTSTLIFGTKLLNLSESECSHLLKGCSRLSYGKIL